MREEEVEGALQSTGATLLGPQVACESRRLTCHFASLILYSPVKEIQPDRNRKDASKRAGRVHQSSHNSPGFAEYQESFNKLCESLFQHCNKLFHTVLESPKMLLCKHTCFNKKEHLASLKMSWSGQFQSCFNLHMEITTLLSVIVVLGKANKEE